ncbi:MAG: hypothetical protein HC794_02900, partial [Nitrospiraceae bacterium]|nr:hypothetical protein [Nitrospiraceae bacterium]
SGLDSMISKRLDQNIRISPTEIKQFVPNELQRGTKHLLVHHVHKSSPQAQGSTALLHSLKHYRVLHEENVVLTIRTSDLPKVPDSEKVKYMPLNDMFSSLIVTFGYMETPNVPKAKYFVSWTKATLSRWSATPAPRRT